MKKSAIKGFMLGICAALALTVTVPVMASSVDAEGFNTFRLKDGDGTVFDWGENLTLEDGKSVPSSITYGGEEYVSMSRLKEMLGDNLLMNGDSATYTFLDAGMQVEYEVVEEVTKPDALGTMWTYQVRKYDGKPNHVGFRHVEINQYYLVIYDEENGYFRAYELLGPSSWEFTEDCAYFAKYTESNFDPERIYDDGVPIINSTLTLTKLMYANTPDTQDGETLHEVKELSRLGSNTFNAEHPYLSNGVIYYFTVSYDFGGARGNGFRPFFHSLTYTGIDLPAIKISLDESAYTRKIDLVKDGYIMYRSINRYANDKFEVTEYIKDSLYEDDVNVEISEEEYMRDINR